MKVTPGYLRRIMEREEVEPAEMSTANYPVEDDKNSSMKTLALVFSPIVLSIAVLSALYRIFKK